MSASRVKVPGSRKKKRSAAIDSPIHINLHDAVIPGFAVKWDLTDLRDLLRPRVVVWRDPTDWMGNVVALGDAYKYSSSDPNVSQ